MDLQKMFDNELEARRAEEMKTSSQLMLGELILKLEAISNKHLSVVFDDGEYHPTGLDSWRGSYRELALDYSYDNDVIWQLNNFLEMLRGAVGQTYVGYKGGDFLMGKNTPVWVAAYGVCEGFLRNENRDFQAVTGVSVRDEEVAIETELMACL